MSLRLWTKVLIIAAVLTIGGTLQGHSPVAAHGKELTIEVSSFTPDQTNSTIRLFRVFATYAGDLDPVENAKVQLSSSRQGGGPAMDDIFLSPINEPGVYAGEAAFPVFGRWDLTLRVSGLGEGEVSFVEEVLPSLPDRDSSEVRQQVLSIFFRFDWKDLVAILVRVAHSLAAVAWFGTTGLILASFWLMDASARRKLLARMGRFYGPVSCSALALLLITGIYTGYFSAPVNPPGVFDFGVMTRIPFGPHYLGVIGFKVLALAAYGILSLRISQKLKMATGPTLGGGTTRVSQGMMEPMTEGSVSEAEKSLLRLAMTNALIALLLVAAITTAIYLHYISHLAALIPN